MEISARNKKESKKHNESSSSKKTNCPKSEELTIFVGGLPSKCTSSDLQNYFQKFGKITSCEPQTWKKGGKKCRGFALVHCANRQTQKKILSKRKHSFFGRNIECKKWFSSREKLEKYSRELKRRKLFVGGLPPMWKSKNLENFFSKFGALDIAYVISNPKTGRSKGFGYIVFERLEDRNKVVKIKDFKFGGKLLSVSEYTDKDGAKERRRGGKAKLRKNSQAFELENFNKRSATSKTKGKIGGFKVNGDFGSKIENLSFSDFSTDSGGSNIDEGSPVGMKNVLKVLDIFEDREGKVMSREEEVGDVSSKLKIFVGDNPKCVGLKQHPKNNGETVFNFRTGKERRSISKNWLGNEEPEGRTNERCYSLFGGFEGKTLSKKFNFSM